MMLDHYRQNKNMLDDSDILIGHVAGCAYFMSRSQYEYWRQTHIALDVTKGRGASFSVEIPGGVRLIVRSRLFEPAERLAL